ncbi:MAG: AsmA-like C-terminal domain-containing protein [Campylobacteraceae bacterium]|nr:AsmA-like C-terminal domain-containing protein [Campylobacteraceae bacterium]
MFDVKITGLYIKLDKKLFVEANIIKINTNVTKSSSSASLEDALEAIPYISTFFNTIIIDSIEYANEKVQLTYKDKNFYLNSSLLTLQTKIELVGRGKLVLDVEEILLKDIDMKLSGKIDANLRLDEYAFDGSFRLFDITGNAKLAVKDKILTYNINSDDFASPKIFMDNLLKYVKLNATIANWIYGYTKATNYKVLFFTGKVDLVKRNFYLKDLNALVEAKDVNVTFNPKVPAGHADEVRVKIEKNKIAFWIQNPTYQGSNLTKADVLIYDFIDGKSGIKIDLSSNAHYNGAINNIVKAYTGVDLPIRQTSGKTDANVSIDVKFGNISVNVAVDVALEDANLSVGNASIYTPHANMRLDNSIIKFIDTRAQYGKLFDISVNGTLNASAKEMIADSFIHSFSIKAENKSIVSISNISTPFTLKISENGTNLYLDELQSNLTFADTNVFRLNSINRLYPYSELAKEYGIKEGRITIRSKDFRRFRGHANIRALDVPLSHDGTPLTRFTGAFEVTEDSFEIAANDKKVNLLIKNGVNLTLNSYDININIGGNASAPSIPITVTAQNGSIIFKPSNITILADEYNISSKDGNISLNLAYKNTPLSFVKSEGYFNVFTKNMKSEFLNALANKEFFKKGSFDFYAKGESEDEFLGVLSLKDTRLKDFKILNNLIAFLNTIPSIATFSDPMYSTSGFPVKNGTIEFIKSKDYVYIQTLFLEGYSSDIKGSGYIDLKDNKIHMDLSIFIVKSLSNIIDKIPLVNYIILGNEGAIEVHLSVRGTPGNPKIETSLMNDTLLSPFNMIKRIFELPTYLLR